MGQQEQRQGWQAARAAGSVGRQGGEVEEGGAAASDVGAPDKAGRQAAAEANSYE